MITRADKNDIGTLAYLMLKWDAELPSHIKALEGDAKYAEAVATLVIVSPQYHTFKAVKDGVVAGGYSVNISPNLFSPSFVATMCMWYVLPKYRQEMLGIRLLVNAIDYVKSFPNVKRFDVAPWADSMNADKLLTRKSIGFMHLANFYSLFL